MSAAQIRYLIMPALAFLFVLAITVPVMTQPIASPTLPPNTAPVFENKLEKSAEQLELMATIVAMDAKKVTDQALALISSLQVEIRMMRNQEAALRREIAQCPVAVGGRTLRREPEPEAKKPKG